MSTTTTTAASLALEDAAAHTLTLSIPSPTLQNSVGDLDRLPTRPYIWPYNPETDRSGVQEVFRQVYHPLYPFAGLLNIAFTVFCRAYLDLWPETCFVLEASIEQHPNGIVGYIVGTPDSKAFCAAFSAGRGGCRADVSSTPAAPSMEEMRDPDLRGRCMEYFGQRNLWVNAVNIPAGFDKVVYGVAADQLDSVPAHFHVAIAPEWRGKSLGGELVNTVSGRLKEMGVQGVFAATPVSGGKGPGRMYEKMGFRRLDVEGDDGQMEEKAYFVKAL